MKKSIALYVALFAALVAVWWYADPAKAATHPHFKLAPPVPCTSKNRMDIFVDEDYIMWECECQMLMTGNICHWQVVGGVDVPEARKHHRIQIHIRPMPV